jgi:hypothetical protein
VARRLGTGALTAIVVAVIVVVAAVPLLVVYKSTCDGRGETETRYSFVPPWDDPPADCQNHRRGFELLRDELSL